MTLNLTTTTQITCTFVNSGVGRVRAIVVDDKNGNGAFERGEPGLEGKVLTLFDESGLVERQVTNGLGKVSFSPVLSDKYSVCLEVESGWSIAQLGPLLEFGLFETTGVFNTQPGTLDAWYHAPCYTFTVGPRQIAYNFFSNTTRNTLQVAPVSAADLHESAVTQIVDASDVATASADEILASDDAWLNSVDTSQSDSIYLPLVER